MKFQILTRSIGFALLASLNMAMNFSPAILPTTNTSPVQATAPLPSLGDFVAMLENGQAAQVVGVYVPGSFALPVIQQPANSPAYVADAPDRLTQFGMAAEYGTTAFLAHNYLSGAHFSALSAGQEVDVVYGDGSIRSYTIVTLRHFQALSPLDPNSNFIDLDANNAQVPNDALFGQIYGQGDRVVFQTCINAQGNASWGRLFVIATPLVVAAAPSLPQEESLSWIDQLLSLIR